MIQINIEAPFKIKSRKGLAEKIIRKKLEQKGWLVWRGGYIHCLRKDELYPNVERKYTLLRNLLQQYHPGTVEALEFYSHVHKGMPDFLCYKNTRFRFIECKLDHESISKWQKRCFKFLIELGFDVCIYRLVTKTSTRKAKLGEKRRIIEKQTRMKKWIKSTLTHTTAPSHCHQNPS